MFSRSLAAFLLISTCALADFSYQQTSRITGGAMAGMMKVAGAFSAKAREPIVSTVMVKGNRMATINRDSIHVIDLDKETFTEVDLSRKTWSVMTFAEMAEAMKRLAAKMGKDAPDVNFKADVKETGQTKDISGFATRQYLVTLTVESQAQNKPEQKGAMDIQMDMWLAPSIAGYDEIRQFHTRMAEKLAWSPMASAAGPFAAQNSKGMAELAKQMSKLDGIPVFQIVRMGTTAGGAAQADQGTQEAQVTQQQEPQQEAPRPNVADAIGGRAGRVIGGLGGFGRKKKAAEEPPPPPPQAAQAAPAQQQQQRSAAPAALMEITTESSGFSSSSVDGSKFEVPAGFKQVDNEMKKALR